MRVKFGWNDSIDNMVHKKTGGKQGMWFLANEAAKFMKPYVPASEDSILSQDIRITAEEDVGHVTYNSPYAHYQYMGEVYGPNIPIMDGGVVVGYFSPPHKHPTGKKMKYSDFEHPLATDHWDKAMMTARRDDLAQSFEKYLKGKRNDQT